MLARAFYENLGFTVFGGDVSQHWLILKERGTTHGPGMTLVSEVDENTAGPGSFIVVDPDGNPILVDQHA
jgi:hypothetical protein